MRFGKQVVRLEDHCAARGQRGDLVTLVGRQPSAFVGTHLREVDTRLTHPDGAGVGQFEAVERTQQGGLAGAGRAEDDGDAALGHRERDVLDDLVIAESLAQMLHFEQLTVVVLHATNLLTRFSMRAWTNDNAMLINQ